MNDFVLGMKKGIPVALGYFAVSFSFGVMAAQGLTPLMATIISATNLTSSGQYAGVQLMMRSASYIEIVLTVLLISQPERCTPVARQDKSPASTR